MKVTTHRLRYIFCKMLVNIGKFWQGGSSCQYVNLNVIIKYPKARVIGRMIE